MTTRGILPVLLPLVCICVPTDGHASSPSVYQLKVGTSLRGNRVLKPGLTRFLRYTVTPDGHRQPIDIWVRELSNGPNATIRLHQQWDEADGTTVVVQDSTFDAATLTPIDHVRRVTREGQTTVGGYRFAADKIVGISDLAGNTRKNFVQPTYEPAFNWEADVELLETLPLKLDYRVSIPFYDPGQEAPNRYIYAVTGSQTLNFVGGRIECWVVSIDFPRDHAKRRFWFTKSRHMMIREETSHEDESVEIKSLLNPEDPDL